MNRLGGLLAGAFAIALLAPFAECDEPELPLVLRPHPKLPRVVAANGVTRELGDPLDRTIVCLDRDKFLGRGAILLRGHVQGVTSLDWSPDAKKFVTGSLDKTAIVWNPETGEQKTTIEPEYPVGFVGFTRDSRSVITGPFLADPVATAKALAADEPVEPNGLVTIWDAANGKMRTALDADQGVLLAIARPNHSPWLATAGSNQTLCLWNVDKLKLDHTWKLDTRLVAVLPSSDGKRLFALGHGETRVRVFNLATRAELPSLEGPKDQAAALFVAADNQVVYIGSGESVGWDLPEEVAAAAKSKNAPPKTGARLGLGFATFGLSELLFHAMAKEAKRPCHVWNGTTGKLIFSGPFEKLDLKKLGLE